MAKAGYSVSTSADVALVAATAKTILAVLAPAQFGVDLKGFEVAFDGVTASDKPVLVEVCTLSAATNSTPGTNNTSETSNIVQAYGRAITTGFTAFRDSSAEPTVLVSIKTLRVTPNGGTWDYDWPYAESPDNDVSKGFALRCTAPTNAVNARASLRWERC